MRHLTLLLALLLSGCAITHTKTETRINYQDTFYIGCINAYLHFTVKPDDKQVPIKAAYDWCTKAYSQIKDR